MIKSCCFTGHREVPREKYIKLMQALIENIEKLARQGCMVFNAGGALGFDTMAAEAVLRVKRKYPAVQLHLYLPYPAQAERWRAADRRMYDYIKENSHKITYATESYTSFSMAKRNRALVDNADFCIAYCEKATGGTAYTLAYAMEKGVDFVNLAMDL